MLTLIINEAVSKKNNLVIEIQQNGENLELRIHDGNGLNLKKHAGNNNAVVVKNVSSQAIEINQDKPSGILFEDLAEEWLSTRMGDKKDNYIRTIEGRLKQYILPEIGGFDISELTSGHILKLCRKVENRGVVETAARVKQIIGQIFKYAIATDRASTDPTAALSGALRTRKRRHMPTITDTNEIARLMTLIKAYPLIVMRCALLFSIYTFARPGEVRQARWREIDPDGKLWRIPAAKMKMKRLHVVPLARQALAILEELRGYTGANKWLFPSARDDGRCMSENGIRMALRAMGYANGELVPHGFRAMASTVLNERGEFAPDVIERQLAHTRNDTRSAYNHAKYLPERRRMMQWWADWLDNLKVPSDAQTGGKQPDSKQSPPDTPAPQEKI